MENNFDIPQIYRSSLGETDLTSELGNEVGKQQKSYLDPEADSDMVTQMLQQADERFQLTFHEDLDESSYTDTKKFILSNLQFAHLEYSSKFPPSTLPIIEILIVDNQEKYHELTNFDYSSELDLAGASKDGKIILLYESGAEYPPKTVATLLRHELMHVYQYLWKTERASPPLWFSEGTAQYFSGETANEPFIFAEDIELTTLEKVDEALASPKKEEAMAGYLHAQHFIKYLVDEFGEDEMITLLFPSNGELGFSERFTGKLSATAEEMYKDWYSEQLIKSER